MKTFFFKIFCTFLFVFFTLSKVISQEQDPFMGNYVLGNSAELYMMYKTNNTKAWLYDLNPGNGTFIGEQKQDLQAHDSSYFDICVGDFDGDGNDEAIQATVGAAGSPNINNLLLHVSGKWEPKVIDQVTNRYDPNIRIVVGDFDGDAEKEFVLAYFNTDDHIHVQLFETDSSLKIIPLTINPIRVPATTGLGDETLFDIAAGDFDGDGLDEIILVENRAKILADPSKENIAEIRLRVRIFDYIQLTKEFKPEVEKNITKRIHEYPNSRLTLNRIRRMLRLTVAAGNISREACEDFIIGYTFNMDHYSKTWSLGWWFFKRNLVGYLLSFKVKCPIPNSYDIVDYLDFTKPIESPNGQSQGFQWTASLDKIRDPGSKWDDIEYRLNAPLTIVCADLNGNGFDEVIHSGTGSISVYPDEWGLKFGILPIPIGGGSNDFRFYRFNERQRRNFTVIDLDVDTSKVDILGDTVIVNWQPEVVVLDCTIQIENQNPKQNPPMRISAWNVDIENFSSSLKARTTVENVRLLANYSMAAGDFDGDALRMGKPKEIIIDGVFQPLVILNSPPVHFDVINEDTIDVCVAFLDVDSSKFFSDYSQHQVNSHTVTTEFTRDWGLSHSFTHKLFLAGSGIRAKLEGHYGNGFSKTNGTSKKTTIRTITNANLRDMIYFSKTQYHFLEYPVFYHKEYLGTILVATPSEDIQIMTWEDIQHLDNNNLYVQNHEIGNILSYKPPDNNFNVVKADKSFIALSGYPVGTSGDQSGGIRWETFDTNDISTSSSFGFSTDLLIKIGYEGDISIKPLGIGAEIHFEGSEEFETTGFYDQKEIQTTKTEINKSWEFSYHLDSYDDQFPGDARYRIIPYCYWSYNGALTLDFATEPLGSWWNSTYGDLPDLTFILPWRHHTERGYFFTSGEEYKRYETKDIFLKPLESAPGDTLEITTRIHNYSLAGISPNDSVNIHYYLGDPDDGGKRITDLLMEGYSLNAEYDISEPRSETWYYARWIIPTNIAKDTRLYVVIDPENTIDEIHENNNKGYVNLNVEGITDIDNNLNNVLPTEFKLSQNYPNPFNPSTHIEFSLPKTEIVKVEILNIMGQRVKTLLHEKRFAGNHKLKFNASNLASGVYFYKITAGEFIKVKKMMFLK